MNNKQQYGLPAPTIPAAHPDGLIPIADLQNDITIHLLTWFTAQEGDTYQLLLNGKLVGSPMSLPSPVPEEGTELDLLIPVADELKSDGIYTVGYRATNVLGGISADSALAIIRIDRTPPGAALLAPMLVPNVTLGETLTATLPGYAGMAYGDLIQTLCNDTEGPSIIVRVEHLTKTPVTIQFERTFLQTLDSEEIAISYQVTDRAGNTSLTSQPVTLTLQV